MPRFTPKRFEQIFAQMIAQAVTRTELSDVSDTAVLKHVLGAAARGDDELFFQMQNLLTLFSLDTAVGEDLDERAKDVQPPVITRRLATKAVGSVVFSRAGTTGTTTIPIGTKVKTAGGVIFTTTTTGEITPTSAEQITGHGVGRDSNPVSVIADLPGSEGRVAANTVVKFEGGKPVGVDEVTNPSAFVQGGLDKETDDAFRQRIKDFIASLARCNPSAIEAGVLNQTDPVSNATVLFAKIIEDIVERGNVTLFIDDGTGLAEETAVSEGTTLTADYTWSGTTTVTSADTSEVVIGDFIGLRPDNQLFEIVGITPDVDVTIANPGGLTIPTGSGAGNTFKNPENVTQGLAGPPADSAVGGETRLNLNNKPLKDTLPLRIISSTRGILTQGVGNEVVINPASGQLDFDPALSTGERIFAEYTYFTGLIAFVQKIVDGDPDDRENFPGLRAAGVLVRVFIPQVLLQNVDVTPTIADGFDQTEVRDNVQEAIKDYINGLTISEDVLRARLFDVIMDVAGVNNVQVDVPAADVIILDDQLARTQDANITVR